jgi:hypothetical protein
LSGKDFVFTDCLNARWRQAPVYQNPTFTIAFLWGNNPNNQAF